MRNQAHKNHFVDVMTANNPGWSDEESIFRPNAGSYQGHGDHRSMGSCSVPAGKRIAG